MKYAIISDIHSNLEALQKALRLIDDQDVDEIICLGDIVGYGANPNECVDIVRSRCSASILGNHDEAALDVSQAVDFNAVALKAVQWTAQELTNDSKSFLSSLLMTHTINDLLFVHSSPRSPELWDYIVDAGDAATAMGHLEEKICFIGHTHIPVIFSRKGRTKLITKEDQFLVNVGSIGQPRDGNPMLAFGIFDSSSWEYHLIRSEYDIQEAVEKINAAGLPKVLGFRLLSGR
jgi:predicted phosphodiesterase